MEYNKIAEAVHKNAEEHGWWEEKRPFATLMALIHSELSEALEEERAAKPFVYVNDENGTETRPEHFNGRKPEGAGIELVDAVIRILDLAGYYEIDFDNLKKHVHDEPQDMHTLIADCHWCVSEAYVREGGGEKIDRVFGVLADVVGMIEEYINEAGYSMEYLIALKHAYNKTRPYKHGKAF